MAICENCKKYPLEYREMNKAITKEGREVILCDDCFKLYFEGKLEL